MNVGEHYTINNETYEFVGESVNNEYCFIHPKYESIVVPKVVFQGSYRPAHQDFIIQGQYSPDGPTPMKTNDTVIIPTTTKDSGKRTTFDSGMVRDVDDNKIMWHAIFDGPMFYRWASLLTRGKRKYPDGEDGQANWLKANGIAEWLRFRASLFRHFVQYFIGMTDEDHAAAIIFNLNGAEYVALTLNSKDMEPTFHKWRWLRNLLNPPIDTFAESHLKKDNV